MIGWVSCVLFYRIYLNRRVSKVIGSQRSPERLTITHLEHEFRRIHGVVNELKGELSLERELRDSILDALPIGVIVVTEVGKIVLANELTRQLFPGFKSRDATHSIEGTLRVAGVTRIFEEIKRQGMVEARDLPLIGDDNRILRVGGNRLGERGGERRVLMILEEVTERRRAERIRREFFGNVSHELRTPITALLATSEMMLEGVDDPLQERRFIAVIRRHAERLHTLIRDLLTLSKLDDRAAIRGLPRDETPIAELCSSVIQTVREAADRWNPRVSLTTEIAHEVPPSARLHRSLMQHALVNLVENAAKHVDESGAIRIIVSRESRSLLFVVADNGCGIAPEHLPRLFERFYRVDKGRSRQEGGSGIGLAIVKHVALAHGGSVDVTSTVGEGSVFTLKIPLAPQ